MGRDQVDNAARIVWHGAGIRLKRSATTAAIKSALQQLGSNRGYRDAARALAKRIRKENSRDCAIEEMERLAGVGRRS
jgi:UDP:flavonoid glycosyltransferase YjiC (YdhE family)